MMNKRMQRPRAASGAWSADSLPERPWKKLLTQGIPAPSLGGREVGLVAGFVLPSLSPAGRPLDIDNLCDPLFSVLVNQVGWFKGTRPNIKWWRASKVEGTPSGCSITVSCDPVPPPIQRSPLVTATYAGRLPRSARDPEVADWSRAALIPQADIPPTAALACYLGFGDQAVNIGDVATGVVKSFIDCLYPVLGGAAGSPADHRIDELTIAKGLPGVQVGAVVLTLWPLDRATAASVVGRRSSSSPIPPRAELPTFPGVQPARSRVPISNP